MLSYDLQKVLISVDHKALDQSIKTGYVKREKTLFSGDDTPG